VKEEEEDEYKNQSSSLEMSILNELQSSLHIPLCSGEINNFKE
jgi:hypothetical protein